MAPRVHGYATGLSNTEIKVMHSAGCAEGHPESWSRMEADSREKGARKLNLSSWKPLNDSQTLTLSDGMGFLAFV